MTGKRRAKVVTGWSAFALLLLLFCAAGARAAQSPEQGDSVSSGPPASSKQPEKQKEARGKQNPSFAAQLAKETREAAGEDAETAQFKQSASVVWLSRFTGGNLQYAYWLAVLLLMGIGPLMPWRRASPERTESIQRAMEEARRASEDANRRLAEIESRLAKLGDEINSMKAAAEKDLATEEARIKAAADEDARKIVESTQQEITAIAKAARRDLTSYAADLAVSLAKKQIHVDPNTDSSLVRSFADRLGGEGGKN